MQSSFMCCFTFEFGTKSALPSFNSIERVIIAEFTAGQVNPYFGRYCFQTGYVIAMEDFASY